ncbi:hypothetical protein TNCV_1983521 [Trichonephila clavipes]|nr:hypothetical protein TNCV_1983521 [Trichonephila clavipes]
MPRIKRRNVYQHMSEFASSRIVVYQECGFSFHDIATCISRNPTTNMELMGSRGTSTTPSIVPEFLRSTSCKMTSARGHGAIVYCLNSGSEDRQTGHHNGKVEPAPQ